MTKRCLAILLALAMAVSVLSACSKQENPADKLIITEAQTQIAEDTTSFKLSYSQSDSLNPFESKTLNNHIVQNLVFESLFVLDESYEAEPCIATGYSYTDTKTMVVTIQNGHTYSDGTMITANDIARSFDYAKVSPRWKNSLAPISDATVTSDNTITFKLEYPDPNAHNLLTFAIAKDDPNKAGFPVGSGRYEFIEEDGGICLKVNPYHKGFTPHFTRIALTNVTTEESIDNAVNIGNITYAYRDLANGDNARIASNKKRVQLNNLVYIGINGFYGITSNESIRKAISLAIDRDTLVKSAYQGYGRSAKSVFNPVSAQGKMTSIFSSSADLPAAKQAIAQSGYGTSKLKLTLLVNDNPNRVAMAQLIKQQLADAGIKVKINQVSQKTYKSYVKDRYYDIYIGETKVPDDMRLNSFFSKKGATNSGIILDKSSSAKAYNAYTSNKGELGAFLLAFSEEMPFVPVLYRQGMICYSKSIHGDMQGYAGNYFSNIQDWYCS